MGRAMIDVEATCVNIKRLCDEKGYTVRYLQEHLGLGAPQTIYKWFEGTNIPSLENLLSLAYLLQTPVEEIVVTTGRVIK